MNYRLIAESYLCRLKNPLIILISIIEDWSMIYYYYTWGKQCLIIWLRWKLPTCSFLLNFVNSQTISIHRKLEKIDFNENCNSDLALTSFIKSLRYFIQLWSVSGENDLWMKYFDWLIFKDMTTYSDTTRFRKIEFNDSQISVSFYLCNLRNRKPNLLIGPEF